MTLQEDILRAIKTFSKKTPVYSAILESTFDLTGSEIRDVIRDLRREGYPICSSDKGYYFSEDPADIKGTKEQLKSRLISLNETIKALEHTEYKYRTKLLNQGDLF